MSRDPEFHLPKDTSHLKKVACAGCGKTPKEVKLHKLSAVTRSFGCGPCILKYGMAALTGEIDRHVDLAVGSKPTSIPCKRGCGRHVVRDEKGDFPLWCSQCQIEYQAIFS